MAKLFNLVLGSGPVQPRGIRAPGSGVIDIVRPASHGRLAACLRWPGREREADPTAMRA